MINFLLLYDDWGLLALRLVLGAILIVHGWPKIKDVRANGKWFETEGFKPGIFWGTIVALLQFVGGIFILGGLLTQVVAAFLIIQFAVAILYAKRSSGVVDGYEFSLLILATSLILLTIGPGDISVDRFFS